MINSQIFIGIFNLYETLDNTINFRIVNLGRKKEKTVQAQPVHLHMFCVQKTKSHKYDFHFHYLIA